MSIAIFASKVFEVNGNKIYSFDGFQYTTTLQTQKSTASKGKPKTYIIGPDLEGITFTLKLDVLFGVNPRTEWEDWKNILESEISYPFVIGNKPVGKNNWLLVSVNPSNFVFDNVGNILLMDLELKFDEFEYLTTATSTSTTKKTTTKTKSSATTLQGLSNGEMNSLIQ